MKTGLTDLERHGLSIARAQVHFHNLQCRSHGDGSHDKMKGARGTKKEKSEMDDGCFFSATTWELGSAGGHVTFAPNPLEQSHERSGGGR